MPAQWLSNSSVWSERGGAVLGGVADTLARPEHIRRLRFLLIALAVLWMVLASTRLMWALVPTTEPAISPAIRVINPISSAGVAVDTTPVDIDRMTGWHLFGEVGAATVVESPPESAARVSALEGIEAGAQETRLRLKLRGIVASTEEGLGHAIIEDNNRQDVYAVGDKLPAPGEVTLAKVMPRQVVLDNGGTYELLTLFEESGTGAPSRAEPAPAAPAEPRQVEVRDDPQTANLAQSYRERLYQNPQSLVDVVNISAVRDGMTMVGYRVSPGRDREQFTQLGFEAGDIVTSVNGVSLDNPANTMALYNSLREAGEVVFELQRGGQQVTLSVNLDGGGR